MAAVACCGIASCLLPARAADLTVGQRTSVLADVGVDASRDGVVTWMHRVPDQSLSDVYAQRFSAAGAFIGEAFKVSTVPTRSHEQPSIAVADDGSFSIAWQGYFPARGAADVFFQRFGADGTPRGENTMVNVEFSENPYQVDPSVTIDAIGRSLVVWRGSGIAARTFAADGSPLSAGQSSLALTFREPAAAMSADGRALVAWSGTSDGSGSGVGGLRLDADGTPVGNLFQVNTTTLRTQEKPRVSVNNAGQGIIVWEGDDGAGSPDIFAQRYDEQGQPFGGEIRVNSDRGTAELDPDVAMDAAGHSIVVWSGTGGGVYAQRLDPSGTPFGDRFLVTNEGRRPRVDMSEDGRYAIAWDNYQTVGVQFGIIPEPAVGGMLLFATALVGGVRPGRRRRG